MDALDCPIDVEVRPSGASLPEAVVYVDLGGGWEIADLTTPLHDAMVC